MINRGDTGSSWPLNFVWWVLNIHLPSRHHSGSRILRSIHFCNIYAFLMKREGYYGTWIFSIATIIIQSKKKTTMMVYDASPGQDSKPELFNKKRECRDATQFCDFLRYP